MSDKVKSVPNRTVSKYHFFESIVYAECDDGTVWWCDPKDPAHEMTWFGQGGEHKEIAGGWKQLDAVPASRSED